MTVCIHGDFIILPQWKIKPPVPWPDIPLSHIILTLNQPVLAQQSWDFLISQNGRRTLYSFGRFLAVSVVNYPWHGGIEGGEGCQITSPFYPGPWAAILPPGEGKDRHIHPLPAWFRGRAWTLPPSYRLIQSGHQTLLIGMSVLFLLTTCC